MHSKYLLFILSLCVTLSWAGTPSYIDLSHDYSSATLHWPSSTPFKITKAIAKTIPNGFYVSVRDYESNEHVGTHMDAPNHFAKGHPGISEIPLTQLIGPAITVDVVNEAKSNPDYQIGIKDFQKWEKIHGEIPAGTIVLLNTGYGKYWSQWALYSGTKKTGADSLTELHFPGLDPAAAKWLVKERKIKAVGIDTFSIDYGQTKEFDTHQILTKENIPIFENVASMEQLPATNFKIIALPMKIKGGTGAPLRIIAELG